MAHSILRLILMIGSLSVPSGRFARGTVLLACYFLRKAEPLLKEIKLLRGGEYGLIYNS